MSARPRSRSSWSRYARRPDGSRTRLRGETLLSSEEAEALTPEARQLLGDPIRKADLYDLEQRIQLEVADEWWGNLLNFNVPMRDLLDDHFVRDLHRRLLRASQPEPPPPRAPRSGSRGSRRTWGRRTPTSSRARPERTGSPGTVATTSSTSTAVMTSGRWGTPGDSSRVGVRSCRGSRRGHGPCRCRRGCLVGHLGTQCAAGRAGGRRRGPCPRRYPARIRGTRV